MSNFLTVTLLAFILFSTTSVSSAQQSQQFYFNGFKKVENNITLNGSSKFLKSGFIQLTNTTERLMGHAFYTPSIKFKDSPNGTVSSFSTSFTFASVPEFRKLGGHGLAFTISPSNDLTWALPSQYLGLFNASNIGNLTNHIFAVEFDTVQDFEFADIDDNHIGIDIDNLKSNASMSAAYFNENSTKVNVTLKSGDTIQAWIDYDSVSNLVNVTISPFQTKPKIPLLSFHVDLSTYFDEYMYVGFSCATGLLSSSHYILGWSFNTSGLAQSLPISKLPKVPHDSAKKRLGLAVGLSVSFFIIFFVLIGLSIWLFRKIKYADKVEEWERNVGPNRFSYKELKEATNGFKEKGMLGRGGFGRVYKGLLQKPDIHIAVKRISHESRQGLREFVSEIASIGRLRHRNLVQLLGWCRRRGDLMLVYEYMPNGSLDRYLFDQPKMILSWEQRFKILKGVASGLSYLHEGWEQVVIHRDVKASNVLLDGELNGRLGDFGLARLHDHGTNLTTTRVVGTLGYLAPELPRTGKATTSTDVFAFGALMLEIVCGRRPIEPKAPAEELVLMDWVWNRWKEGKVIDVVDPRLEGNFDRDEVIMVLKLGLMCSSDVPMARPNMRQVLRYLEKEGEVSDMLRPPYGSVGDKELPKEFVHSLASSSEFDRVSLNSYEFSNGNEDCGPVSTSPFSHTQEDRQRIST